MGMLKVDITRKVKARRLREYDTVTEMMNERIITAHEKEDKSDLIFQNGQILNVYLT
jgi:hypothetical protein